jgi:hypothetical protein
MSTRKVDGLKPGKLAEQHNTRLRCVRPFGVTYLEVVKKNADTSSCGHDNLEEKKKKNTIKGSINLDKIHGTVYL